MKYMYPVRPTMTAIATNFLNLPFANEIMDAFKEYSNKYEFTANGVFRRITPLACPQCGKHMSHNGYNKYDILGLAIIKLGRYHGSKCGPTLLSNLAPPPLYMAFHYECSPKFHALLKEEGRSNKSTH